MCPLCQIARDHGADTLRIVLRALRGTSYNPPSACPEHAPMMPGRSYAATLAPAQALRVVNPRRSR